MRNRMFSALATLSLVVALYGTVSTVLAAD